MSTYTKKQIKQVFSQNDKEDMGLLDGPKLLNALKQLNLPMSKSDLPDLFASVGREEEGLVAVDDFVDLVTELMNTDDNDGDIPGNQREEDEEYDYDDDENEEEDDGDEVLGTDIAFNMLIDPNLNAITLDTLIRVCKEQNEDWSRQEIMEMLNQADLNHDGIIDLKEFRELCKKTGLAK